MMALVQINPDPKWPVWIIPSALEALIATGNDTVLVLESGQNITVTGATPDDVMDRIDQAMRTLTGSES